MPNPLGLLTEAILDHYVDRTGQCSCGDYVTTPKNPRVMAEHTAAALIKAGWRAPLPEALDPLDN